MLESTVSIAIEALEKTKQEITERYKQDMAELDRVIANIKQLPSTKKTPKGINPAVGNGKPALQLPDNWAWMNLTDAVHACLSNYSEPVPFAELMSGLRERGVKLGDPAKPQRFQANVKTTVVNNRHRFRYDRKKDTVVLVRAAAAS